MGQKHGVHMFKELPTDRCFPFRYRQSAIGIDYCHYSQLIVLFAAVLENDTIEKTGCFYEDGVERGQIGAFSSNIDHISATAEQTKTSICQELDRICQRTLFGKVGSTCQRAVICFGELKTCDRFPYTTINGPPNGERPRLRAAVDFHYGKISPSFEALRLRLG